MENHKGEVDKNRDLFFKTDKDYESERLKGYFLGLFSPYENLSKLKKEIQEMKYSTSNLKRYKAIMHGFLLGLQHRQKARLNELEQIKNNPQSKDIGRER